MIRLFRVIRIVPNDLVSLTFLLFYGFYSFDVTRLMLLVNHGGLPFFTVITLLGMWVFAASIMIRVMLLVDISTSIHQRQLLSIRLKVTPVEYKKLSAYMMNGIWLNDSILLLWAYDSESGLTRVGQPQSIIYYGDYSLTLGLTGTNYVQSHM